MNSFIPKQDVSSVGKQMFSDSSFLNDELLLNKYEFIKYALHPIKNNRGSK